MEVTPEVDTFFHGGMGNHFLLSSSNDVVNNGEKSEEGRPKLCLVYKSILRSLSLNPKRPILVKYCIDLAVLALLNRKLTLVFLVSMNPFFLVDAIENANPVFQIVAPLAAYSRSRVR